VQKWTDVQLLQVMLSVQALTVIRITKDVMPFIVTLAY